MCSWPNGVPSPRRWWPSTRGRGDEFAGARRAFRKSLNPVTGSRQTEAYRYCETLLRGADRSRYLGHLMAPAAVRPHLDALAAFDLEIRRVPLLVREPGAGEIRLKWWHDAIAAGAVTGNPVADALCETIRSVGLPVEAFQRYLEARTFDLYGDPVPSVTALEGYAGDTASAIIQMGVVALDAKAAAVSGEAAGHAGVAWTIAGILSEILPEQARGRSWLPPEILQAAGLAPEGAALADDAASARAVSAMAALGLDHIGRANAALAGLPGSTMPAFLSAAPAHALLKKAAKRPQRCLVPQGLRISPLAAQWSIWRAARRGRI